MDLYAFDSGFGFWRYGVVERMCECSVVEVNW